MIIPSLLPKRVYKGLVLFLHKCSKNLQVRPSEIRVLFMGRFVITNLILPNVLNGKKGTKCPKWKKKAFPSVFRTIPKVLHRRWPRTPTLQLGDWGSVPATQPCRLLSSRHSHSHPTMTSSQTAAPFKHPAQGISAPSHTHKHLNSSTSRWVRPMHTHGCHSCREPVLRLGDPVSTHLFQ